jgi:tRNA-splicing ligase RtcB
MNRSNTKSAMREFGTLGSGNHFVEIQANVHGEIFVMIHTGSRVLGQHIRADAIRRGERVQRPKGLVTLAADSAAGQDYLANVDYAVRYATENRMEILRQVIEAFRAFVPSMRGISADKIIAQAIDTPHNFIARENHGGEDVYVHRKGAIRVRHGDIGLIPGSMGTSSYIVRGKGNEASLWSSSHGAGRRLTRGQAMKTIKPERYEDTMVGIIARRDGSILDEAPDAYKDIDVIMGYQRDLVAIVEKLRPLAVVKG